MRRPSAPYGAPARMRNYTSRWAHGIITAKQLLYGYAQAIRPVHSTADGDTIYLMASGEVEVGVDALGALVTECMGRAINRAALNAEPAYGLKSAQSFAK